MGEERSGKDGMPQPGGAIEALVRQTAATPKPVIEKAVKLSGWK